MDPYLEGSEWTSIHHELSSELGRQLVPQVTPKYFVRTVRRFMTETPEDVAITKDDIYPNTGVYDAQRHKIVRESAATLMTSPLEMVTVMPEREPQITVEIRDAAHRQLVTAIEVLSPTNKRGEGYREYVEKREGILRSTVHLLEIDLLRKGKRVSMRQPLPTASYFVFLSRAERRPVVEVWPLQLSDRLPIVPVPLLAGDADATLDLQLALTAAYHAFRYDLALDYTRPPETPLEGDDVKWAEGSMKAAGFAMSNTTNRRIQ
jgi:hypothetical protein